METHKYAPNSDLSLKGGKIGRFAAVKYIGHPPGTKPQGCPLRVDIAKLEIVLENGDSSWWGVDRFYINSELRPCCVVTSYGNCELRQGWEDVPESLRC